MRGTRTSSEAVTAPFRGIHGGFIGHTWIALLVLAACGPGGNAGLILPAGFIAERFTNEAPGAWHLVIAENGDVVVALEGVGDNPGGVRVFRDADGDGVADTVTAFGEGTGSDVVFHDGFLYFASRADVVRYPWEVGVMLPAGPPDTVVSGLPSDRYHSLKTIAFDSAGAMYVNIGSPTNVCTPTPVEEGATSLDPCPELANRAGIWRFSTARSHQTQTDGVRWVTGVRNAVALNSDGRSVQEGAGSRVRR